MGKTSRGYQRNRWQDEILQDIRVFGVKNWTKVLVDRQAWHEVKNPQSAVGRTQKKAEEEKKKKKEKEEKKKKQKDNNNNNNNNQFNTTYSLLVSCCVLKYTGFSFSIEYPTLFFELYIHVATINNTTCLCNFIHILMCGLNMAQEPPFYNLVLECDQSDSELGVT